MQEPKQDDGMGKTKKEECASKTFKMLVDREGNHSTRGRFSVNDRGHGLSPYLHVNEP